MLSSISQVISVSPCPPQVWRVCWKVNGHTFERWVRGLPEARILQDTIRPHVAPFDVWIVSPHKKA